MIYGTRKAAFQYPDMQKAAAECNGLFRRMDKGNSVVLERFQYDGI